MLYGNLSDHIFDLMAASRKPAGVYVVYGADDYFRKNAVKCFEGLIDESFADFDISRFDGDAGGLFDALSTLNMVALGGEWRLVILQVGQKLSESDAKQIAEYASSPCEGSLFVVEHPTDAKPAIKGAGVEFIDCAVKPEEMNDYILNVCDEEPSIEIERAAIEELKLRTGASMTRIVTEIEKLKSYSNGKITLDDVKTMVMPELENRIYMLTDAVSKRDSGGALSIFGDLCKNGISGVTVINQLYDKYRKMLHLLLHKDMPREELAKLLDLKSQGQIFFLKKSVEGYTQLRLKKCVDYLHGLQLSVLSGKINEANASRQAIFELLVM